MDDLINDFLAETNEGLAELDNDIVTLEQNPNDKDLLSKIFRVMHTIKGTCGFLGLPRLEGVAHKAEDVLGLFRTGELEVTPEYVTLILDAIDRIKFIVNELGANGAEPEGSDDDLIPRLEAVLVSAGQSPDANESVDINALQNNGPSMDDAESTPGEEETSSQEADTAEADLAASDTSPEENNAEETPPAPVAAKPQEAKAPAPVSNEQTASATKPQSSLRVNVEVIENLMTMVSELVLTRNQLLQISRQSEGENNYGSSLQRLNHVVSDLQEGVMKTRMQPVGNAWNALPRIIRDIANELGKKIKLEMKGQDTELDRQVLELIKDPLTHMIRNSADHGIEKPEDRLAAGKPETGTIFLNSYHEGGHIIIQIKDDGKGLAVEKLKEKALANNLATPEEIQAMSPAQIQKFIFHAGFSTAEKITSVSGRGVGMDVVRTNIEKIGGTIDLQSAEGEGTTFTIKIPLTLAIISALIVESGGERYAIPQLAVQELVMSSTDGANRIEMIKGTPVFRLRDHLLPLISLKNLLGLSQEKIVPPPEQPMIAHEDQDDKGIVNETTTANDNRYIVVTQLGNYTFGIIVDRVFDTEEIVVKPVSKRLKAIDIFSGNTILGDGSVVMILDPAGIARRTGEIDTADSQKTSRAKELAHQQNTTSLILFRAGSKAPKAVPLELVSRLEKIDMNKVEIANGKPVLQYRDQLMPLIHFEENQTIQTSDEEKPVLVFNDRNRSLGLVVEEIIDITDAVVDIKMNGGKGVIGTAVINEKATDVVDIAHHLARVSQNWFQNHANVPFNAKDRSTTEHADPGANAKRLLLVEDSPFFRNMLVPLLNAEGYEVSSAPNAMEALKMYEEDPAFDAIISDIEMPEMSGFELAKKIRGGGNGASKIPLVALTSHATPEDISHGMEVGFNKYIAKFDRETLLNTLNQVILEKGDAA